MPETPPRGLRWAATGSARAVATVLAIVSLLTALYVGFRQQEYVTCVAGQQMADAVRTQAIARATDNERRAQYLLLSNIRPENAAGLKAAVLDAYDVTDRVRAANPPVPPGEC